MSEMFRILAADKLADEGLAYIRAQSDTHLEQRLGLSEAELVEIIGEFDGLIVRSGIQVTAAILRNPGRLKAVARAGVGVDNIDLDAATAAGVLVMNAAESSTITTAEHAFALMLSLARNIGPAYKTMTEGGWDRAGFQGHQLAGKTLGVVGFGRIGQTVAARALAFDMQVLAHDPFFNAETAMDGRVKMCGEFLDLLPQVDVLTFHVPATSRTLSMMNTEAFEQCRDGVLVVNASRGGIVAEQDLLSAVESGKCGGAALDVFATEPLEADSPLRHHRSILTTPHLGASTVEAQEAVSIDAAVALLEYLRGEGVRGAVNVAGLRLDLDPLQSRFVELAQRIAMVISPMTAEGISRVTIELSGQSLMSAATTIERMALIGLLQPHLDTSLNLVNVRHVSEQRGIILRTVSREEEKTDGPQIAIAARSGDRTHRVVGRVYSDMRPRLVEINGYHMDMVPAGHMVLIRNDDKPGMIGRVGTAFGIAGVNIADMAISRRDDSAMMLLRVDAEPPPNLETDLLSCPGISKVARVRLPDLQ